MSKESLLTKARELIATRLEQSQVRRGAGVVIRNSDRNTIAIDSEGQGGEPSLAPRKYRAGEIVVTGDGVKVAPFLIKVHFPCDDPLGTGYPTSTGASNFLFKVPRVGSTNIDAVSPPVLSTADSGAVYLTTKFAWGGWTGPFPLYESHYFYYLVSAEITTAPIGTDPSGFVYDQLMVETGTIVTVDGFDYTSKAWSFQYPNTYSNTLLGWWEKGGNVFQSLSGAGNVVFGVPFTAANTTEDDNRIIEPLPPTAYLNPL